MSLQTLSQAEQYLNGLINHERTQDFDYEALGLGRIRALLVRAGHPERGLACIHIAGSKGKGSVALATEALLLKAGTSVGTFTSPHLESWCERFRVNGASVSDEKLLQALNALKPAIDIQQKDVMYRPSFFDVATVLALEVFRRENVDVGVIEVGLGGRLDSTNIVNAHVSVLTSVQLEHTDKLGTTREAIAREKMGIARAGIPLMHGPLSPDALPAVLAAAVVSDTPLEQVDVRDVQLGPDVLRFSLRDGREVTAPPFGAHQATNLALAIHAVEALLGRTLLAAEIAELKELRLPARVESFGDLLLDSAHTPDSAVALAKTLEARWPGRSAVGLVSISRDKHAGEILAALAPQLRVLVLTHAETLRSADPNQLREAAHAAGIESVEIEPEPKAAFDRALALRKPGELVLITGSIYLAGKLRARCGQHSSGIVKSSK